jgi:hypothetical protein
MRRSSLFWGAVLILLGGLLLLQSMGIRLPNDASVMDYFWPLLLILVGGWFIFGVFFQGEVEEEQVSVPLNGASQAAVRFNHAAGKLTIGPGADAGQVLSGTFAGGMDPKVELNGDRLKVKVRPSSDFFPFFWNWRPNGMEWDIRLTGDVPLNLKLETGASQTEIDLRDLRVVELDLDAGASSIDLTLPANAGLTRADVDLGAASLDVHVPEGVAVRVKVDQGVSSVEIDQARFPRFDKVYQSPDYETAANRVDMKIDAGAGRIVVH